MAPRTPQTPVPQPPITEAIVNAGNGKVTVKASEVASPSPTATASQGTVTVSEGSIIVSGADCTGITAETNRNITVNGDSKGSAKANEKAEENSGKSNSATSNSIVSTATGYSRIEIGSDGSWSYHAPNGDIIEVESDGSWTRQDAESQVSVQADGFLEHPDQRWRTGYRGCLRRGDLHYGCREVRAAGSQGPHQTRQG